MTINDLVNRGEQTRMVNHGYSKLIMSSLPMDEGTTKDVEACIRGTYSETTTTTWPYSIPLVAAITLNYICTKQEGNTKSDFPVRGVVFRMVLCCFCYYSLGQSELHRYSSTLLATLVQHLTLAKTATKTFLLLCGNKECRRLDRLHAMQKQMSYESWILIFMLPRRTDFDPICRSLLILGMFCLMQAVFLDRLARQHKNFLVCCKVICVWIGVYCSYWTSIFLTLFVLSTEFYILIPVEVDGVSRNSNRRTGRATLLLDYECKPWQRMGGIFIAMALLIACIADVWISTDVWISRSMENLMVKGFLMLVFVECAKPSCKIVRKCWQGTPVMGAFCAISIDS